MMYNIILCIRLFCRFVTDDFVAVRLLSRRKKVLYLAKVRKAISLPYISRTSTKIIFYYIYELD